MFEKCRKNQRDMFKPLQFNIKRKYSFEVNYDKEKAKHP